MKKRIRRISSLVVIAVLLSILLSACTSPFNNVSQGLTEDKRTYSVIKDTRMDAVAPEYKGYIYKQEDRAFCFRLKSPKNIEENTTYPLIIFLHGSGDWGNNNSSHMYKSLIDNIEKYVDEDTFVFMPQSIKKHSWEEDTLNGKGMDDLYNLALEEIINTFAINTDRIYLTGMSMGGYGTFYQAYNNPGKYTAIAPICGYFPEKTFIDLSTIKNLPIWLGHSRTDTVVNFTESEKLFNRLIAIGATNVKTTWLEAYKHDMTEPFYDNEAFWKWLMSQKK